MKLLGCLTPAERLARVVPYEEFRARRDRHVPRLPFGPPKPRLTLAEAAHRMRMLAHIDNTRKRNR